jgi:N-acetylated-alpha-linked acidic dipeptidase
MRFSVIVLFVLVLFQPASAQQISGFTDKTVAAQRLLEQRFDALLSAQHVGQTIKELSSKPHHVGSPGGKEVAESILAKYKSWGWDAKIETYQVLFPTPKIRVSGNDRTYAVHCRA